MATTPSTGGSLTGGSSWAAPSPPKASPPQTAMPTATRANRTIRHEALRTDEPVADEIDAEQLTMKDIAGVVRRFPDATLLDVPTHDVCDASPETHDVAPLAGGPVTRRPTSFDGRICIMRWLATFHIVGTTYCGPWGFLRALRNPADHSSHQDCEVISRIPNQAAIMRSASSAETDSARTSGSRLALPRCST